MVDRIFIGRRKHSVARIILKSGNGKITVTVKNLKKHFLTGKP